MTGTLSHVKWFRDASPYINAHRGKTFVLYLGGEALEHDNFQNIIGDILLLHSLGVRLVLVHGAAPQIDRYLEQAGLQSRFVDGIRVTDPDILPLIQQAVGKAHMDVEAALCRGSPNAPQQNHDVTVVSGNAIKARPLGIINGQDFHHTGRVRKVNTRLVNQLLDQGAIVLMSHIGFSPTGELFNIHSAEVARETARALVADKLILFIDTPGIRDENGNLLSEIETQDISPDLAPHVPLAIARVACTKGVNRCHLISYQEDGALLGELFTRDGAGTQVVRFSYERIRAATPDDIPGIIHLIEPLEEEGILVRRPRELIEAEIDRFTVIDRDGLVVGCAALYPFEDQAELACLAIHPDYRDGQRGEALLKALLRQAREAGCKALFALTTQTGQWFLERGFSEQPADSLPASRKQLYNYKRNSKLFTRTVN